ncbi:Na/Pi cotransporter family protein [Clostridium sp. 'deep sea']|uniref:Na/Pi cotransporter family protein n=1 Tax=Clostridium sp. 'deep sea' TaxID=2779445 RepID=UPI0018964E20|nr:Na/Pi cotransporter family protein [Clostridium sp. 'deep sea']QOR36557.1 Na/Pi cotransporter family protein [Clostridium sp. 'deep sea']
MLDFQAIGLSLVAGLGLFLYGMQLMAGGLQKAAGDRMRRLLEVLTSNSLLAVLVGTVTTAIVQSSSATSVMVIGFVNAGLMTLKQAVGVILGANIGTTITTQMVSFKLTHFAPVAIGIGIILLMFGKKRSTKDVGEIFLGFGILFFGMDTMSEAMKPLRTYQPFIDLMASVAQNPLLGVAIATVFTAIIQSSSATTAIVVALASQGLLDFEAALPLILGSNIGTTITALIASINTSLTSRRAAIAHAIFNVGGVVIFMLILKPFSVLAMSTSTIPERQIANAHTIFNIANTLMLVPFITYYVRFIEKIVPEKSKDKVDEGSNINLYLDRMLLSNPSIALGQATREIYRMGEIALDMLNSTEKAFLSDDIKLIKHAYELEQTINQLEREVMDYLVDVSQSSLTEDQSVRLNYLFECVNDIERIGDHTENIAELAENKVDKKLPFSKTAYNELNNMYNEIRTMVEDSLDVLKKHNEPLIKRVGEKEQEIDLLEAQLRKHHIKRLSDGTCHPQSGIVYLDIISNFERIADHANNVCVRSS